MRSNASLSGYEWLRPVQLGISELSLPGLILQAAEGTIGFLFSRVTSLCKQLCIGPSLYYLSSARKKEHVEKRRFSISLGHFLFSF